MISNWREYCETWQSHGYHVREYDCLFFALRQPAFWLDIETL